MRRLYVVAWFCVTSIAFAGEMFEVSASKVEEFSSSTWSIESYVDVPSFNVKLRSLAGDSSKEVMYVPSTSAMLGLGVARGCIGLRGALSVPQTEEDERLKGDTSYADYRLSLVGRAALVNFNYQRYDGMYIENSSKVDPQYRSGDPYVQRPDVSVRNYSAKLTVAFFPKRFSLRAADSQLAKQKRSGGSVLGMFSYSDTQVHGDEPLVPEAIRDKFGNMQLMTEGTFRTLSGAGGYGYTVVYHNFFASGRASLGVGIQQQVLNVAGNESSDVGIAGKIDFNLSTGYSGNKFFAGARVYMDMTTRDYEDIAIESQLNAASVFCGFRI